MKRLHACTGKCIIEPTVTMTNLGNGLLINNETQSRKDIISGIVVDGVNEDCIVYFPLYSASPLTYEGKSYMILDSKDILAIESDDTKDNN